MFNNGNASYLLIHLSTEQVQVADVQVILTFCQTRRRLGTIQGHVAINPRWHWSNGGGKSHPFCTALICWLLRAKYPLIWCQNVNR